MASNMEKISKRERKHIRAWMINQGITGVSVASRAGVSSALVSATLGGVRNNPKVLRCLAEMGCPRALLVLPEGWEETPGGGGGE